MGFDEIWYCGRYDVYNKKLLGQLILFFYHTGVIPTLCEVQMNVTDYLTNNSQYKILAHGIKYNLH